MEDLEERMLAVLKFNGGFTHPERWIKYGLRHNFGRIQSEKLEECPGCKCRSFDAVGQYVYYSTLVSLQACARCRLVFSDRRIDSTVIQSHFERTYKDEVYFLDRRRRIFEQISALADVAAVQGGNILDVGGAKGHLLAMLKRRRSDLRLVVNDLSKEACDYAAHKYGFQTICSDVNALEGSLAKFDVIIMSDVIYYEPDLQKLWRVLAGLVAKNGSVIIRVPNRFALIYFWQLVTHGVRTRASAEMRDHVRFFNSEHLYVFSRPYLLTRLKELGFTQVTAIPSELLVKNRGDFWHPLYFFFCKIVSKISCGKLILTPSVLVIAKNHE